MIATDPAFLPQQGDWEYFPCAGCGAEVGKPCAKSCDASSLPDNEVERVSCECGAAKLGHANYSPAHSSWCPVAG